MNTPSKQPLRVSIAGPIGSGKTLLINGLSKRLWPAYSLAVATVDNPVKNLWSLCDDRQEMGPPIAFRGRYLEEDVSRRGAGKQAPSSSCQKPWALACPRPYDNQIPTQAGPLSMRLTDISELGGRKATPLREEIANTDISELGGHEATPLREEIANTDISELGGHEATPLREEIVDLELVLVEYGGNDLAMAFNTELVDLTVYVVDVTSGKEVICRGGTGLVHSDLLILNKADLAPYLGISLAELEREIRRQRDDRPFVFTDLQREVGLDEIVRWLEAYLLLPVEQRSTRKEKLALIEEQWFWRYKMSRGAHAHFDPTMRKKPLSSAPMSAAPLCYTDNGQVAWDQMWTDFCDLAAIGGPPHRGTLLEPVSPTDVKSNPETYAQVVAEIERGIQLVTGLTTLHSPIPGWVGVECEDEMMAIWLQQAILAENVSVRRDASRLYLPAGPTFQLKEEIKNVITVIAKTHHYWQEHLLWQRSEGADTS